MPQINQVFLANSAYSLFTYLVMFPDKTDTTVFVVGPAIKDIAVKHKIPFDMPASNATQAQINDTAQKLVRHAQIYAAKKQVPCYGNANTITTPYADAFVEAFPFYALSDGLSDTDRFPAYCQNNHILKCYSSANVLGELKHDKIHLISISDLWAKLPQSTHEAISKIFGVSAQSLETAASRSVVLVTQPLSEDNMMSEQDKVELYTRIINKYGAENVVIKPHPREKTNWQELFCDIPAIPRQIPMELLTQLVDVKRIATFFSTAAFGNVPDEKVDFYSKDFDSLKSFHPNTTRLSEPDTSQEYKSVSLSDIEKTYASVKKCKWHKIPGSDGRFYHAPAELDSAGIPTYLAPYKKQEKEK